MGRLITIMLIVLSLTACMESAPVRVRTEVQEQFVPLLYCPAPKWEGLERPELPIDGITAEDSPGEVAKRYKATVRALQDHARRLERALEEYDTTNETYEELRKRFTEEWKQEFHDGEEAPKDK